MFATIRLSSAPQAPQGRIDGKAKKISFLKMLMPAHDHALFMASRFDRRRSAVMNRNDNHSYYTERARQERERANVCEDNSLALTHLRFAEAYEQRVQALAAAAKD
jgi:hypothetical protein